ncbi:alpha-2,8-sialyltransferase 8E-like [Saccoglossus kowalevskii]
MVLRNDRSILVKLIVTNNGKELENGIAAWEDAIVTQENTKANTSLHYAIGNGRTPITQKIYKILPKKSPFTVNRFGTCSVVGNGGILINGSCGNVIDKSEFVFRCNLATIGEYARDVGRKTNLTSINKLILRQRYGGLKGQENVLQFQLDMAEYPGLLWLPAFANHQCLEDCYRAREEINSGVNEIVFGNPNHFLQVSRYWRKKYNLRRLLTTGFYLVNVALALCEETHLFGFWPFLQNPNEETLKFHYYDDMHFEKAKLIHSFPIEFKILHDLHQNGVLQLHVDTCYDGRR